jgi:hypothetical protein
MNGKVFPAAKLTDLIRCSLAVVILTVAGGLFQIGINQSLKDFFMASFGIIIMKIDHIYSPKYKICSFYFLSSNLSSGIFITFVA